jgi:hypothetical protein
VKPARSAAVLLALALSLAACSSSSSSSPGTSGSPSPSATANALSPADYIAGVCSAMTNYQQDVQQLQTSFNPNQTDLALVKQSWLGFLDGMLASTQTLVSDIEALGVPDTSDGEAAAQALKTDFEQLKTNLQDLRDHSASLSPESPADFMTNFEALITQFQSDMSTFGQDLDQFNGDEIDQAFSNAPECASIAGSASPSA